jgi:hypothetical protein
MAQVSGTTDSYDLVGIAEDVEDIIYDLSPTDTPLRSMAKRGKADAILHQWQTDALDAAATNRQIEGDDASYTTASPTVMLSNYTQIVRKTLIVSRTADRVRKYGRDRETARLIVKRGKELNRDVEYASVRNQASSAGGSATARSSAGIESMITNRVLPTTSGSGTTPGYASGVWAAPTDGTATGAGSTFTEDMLKSAMDLSWVDGGDASVIMTNTYQKKVISTFAGANKFAGTTVNANKSSAGQGVVIGAVDVYIGDHGEYRVKLNRWMRQSTVLLLDPEHLELAWLDRIKPVPLAKTGDADKQMLIGEFTFVVGNPDAHAKIQDLYSA